MKKIFYVLLVACCFISCKSDKEEINDYITDTIGLSAKQILLSSFKDSKVISTKGKWWWINAIEDESKVLKPNYKGDEIGTENIEVVGEWFKVERVNMQTIRISVEENTNTSTREITVILQSGNYFDYIKVEQKKKSD